MSGSPRFEVFGEAEALTELAAALEPALSGAALRLDEQPRPDPADGGLRQVLQVFAADAEAAWELLYAQGVRVWRRLPAEPASLGIVVGPAPAPQLEAALDALAEAAQVFCLVPPGPRLDDGARQALRGRARILALGAGPDDPDRPPERVELSWAMLRCTAPLPSAPAALALLNKQEPRLLITPHRGLRAASLERTWPHEPGEQALDPAGRYHLGLAPLARGGGALLVRPDRARWIPLG